MVGELLIGVQRLGPGRAAERDPLQIIIDITGLGTTGYRAADWLRENHGINMHLSDHRRISAQFTYADDPELKSFRVLSE